MKPKKMEYPKPSEREQALAKYFELELYSLSITAYNNGDYMKATMLSWSCIEECFLPQLLEFISRKQNVKLSKKFLEGNGSQLISYYFMLSYDEELYKTLETGRKLRNKVTHDIYKSGSIESVNTKAKTSALFNIDKLIPPMVERLNGTVPVPSLQLYANGWNDMRNHMLKAIDKERQAILSGNT